MPPRACDRIEAGEGAPENGGSEGGTLVCNDEPSAELTLLANLRLRRRELQRLFDDVSDHWRFEDPVYRFYHQSFKVYLLQEETEAIVRTLKSLAPDRPLSPWFVEIVNAGTGKRFKPEDNAEWMRVTRPFCAVIFSASSGGCCVRCS